MFALLELIGGILGFGGGLGSRSPKPPRTGSYRLVQLAVVVGAGYFGVAEGSRSGDWARGLLIFLLALAGLSIAVWMLSGLFLAVGLMFSPLTERRRARHEAEAERLASERVAERDVTEPPVAAAEQRPRPGAHG
jgi:hypothetical protein